MSVGTEVQPPVALFAGVSKIPIARLNPNADGISTSYIEADVALLWPYSSSTRRLSLLLAEKDIRLRKFKGQVKINFHGACAQEVAKTHLGIGDSVKVALKGATWTNTGGEVSTPGRKVDWDIDIKKDVMIEIGRIGNVPTSVVFTSASSSESSAKSTAVEKHGPKAFGTVNLEKCVSSALHFSPSRRLAARQSSRSFIDASLDPFADDDDFVIGSSRKRTKFARHSGSWQLINDNEEVVIGSDQYIPSSPSRQIAVSSAAVNDSASQNETEHKHHQQREQVTSFDDAHQTGPLLRTEIPDALGSYTEIPKRHDLNEPVQLESAEKDRPLLPAPNTPQTPPRQHLHLPEEHITILSPTLRPLLSPGLDPMLPLTKRQNAQTEHPSIITETQSELDSVGHTVQQVLETSDTIISISCDEAQAAPSHTLQTEIDHEGTMIMQVEEGLQKPTLSEIGQDGILEADELYRFEVLSSASEVHGATASPKSPVQMVEISSDLPGESFDAIDLDALQQQIDESNGQLYEFGPPSPIEDQDMYGPPIIRSQPSPLDIELHMVNEGIGGRFETFTEDSKPELSVTEADSSLLQNQSSLPEPQQPSSAAIRVDFSSEDSEDESAEEGKEAEESEPGKMGSVGMTPEDGTGLVPEVIEDLFDLREQTHDQFSVYAKAKPENLTLEAQTLSPVNQPADEQHSTSKSSEENKHQFASRADGTDEPVEDELERLRQRWMMVAEKAADDLPQEETLDGPEQDSLSELLPEGTSPVEPQESASADRSAVESVTDQDESGYKQQRLPTSEERELEQVHLEENYSEAEDFAPEQENLASSPVSPFLVPEPALENTPRPPELNASVQEHQAMPTPDATQPTVETPQKIAAPVSLLKPNIPLSPDPTQSTGLALQPLLSQIDGPGDIEKAIASEVQLPEQRPATIEQTLKTLQRLTRKSFTSEKIISEYFAPRRSLRIKASSPPVSQDEFSTPLQRATSPRKSEMTMPSSPLLTQQLEAGYTAPASLNRGTSTSLSYFPHLSSLNQYFNEMVDVIAVCTTNSTQPQRAKSGPKDYFTTLCLADASFADNNPTVRAQIFRFRKGALPTANRGDVVLLRQMKVQSYKHNIMLLSTDASSWAVFNLSTNDTNNVAIAGPPVEYADLEKKEVENLRCWWSETGRHQYPNVSAIVDHDNHTKSSPNSTTRITRSQRRKDNVTDPFENASQAAERTPGLPHSHLSPSPGPLLEHVPSPTIEEPTSPIRRSKRQARRSSNSRRSESVVHELRDGTKYVDEDGGRQRSTSVIHELRDGSTYINQ